MAANTYIVLFRGINVGGNKVVRMELLRQMLTDLGFANIATYIQSGNVVLTTDKAPAAVTKAIEDAFPGAFGFSSRPTVRSLQEWLRMIDEDPFTDARNDGKQVHAVFLDAKPDPKAIDALKAIAGTEQMVMRHGVLYLFTPDGFGRSKVAGSLDKVLKVPWTARNWNTVLKLQDLAVAASQT